MKILFILLFSLTIGFTQSVDSRADSLFVKNTNISNTREISRSKKDRWFSQDKFLHFYFSATISGLSYYLYTYRLARDEDLGKIYSVSFTAIIGLGKEVYDKKKKGHFSWKDLCWDGLGLAAGYFLFIHDY